MPLALLVRVRQFIVFLLLSVSLIATPRAQNGIPAPQRQADAGATSRAELLAVDEMLGGSRDRAKHWAAAPELVVLMSVLDYASGPPQEYTATTESVQPVEADEIERDITSALNVLTASAFKTFSAVRRETAVPGSRVRVIRDGQIVVARYRGVRSVLGSAGYGGTVFQRDGTILSGIVILDNEFDRISQHRNLLRTHELGHALGYSHVTTRRSIMNPALGSEPTDLDRTVALVAFGGLDRTVVNTELTRKP